VYLEPVLKVLKENKKKFLEKILYTDQLINISALQPSYQKHYSFALSNIGLKKLFGKIQHLF
jgi:hypothetical protein